eukprot:TRINITY_DN30646_c0_g1_i1.p1 TRINITY_DN30646_c0_g1~~TRINITY_DN30646_c0_g1_i1.p1  ORF type:complete len:585 (+),score=64.77 TRINITY_DN30646_c0_g1_i1:87-1841(+)
MTGSRPQPPEGRPRRGWRAHVVEWNSGGGRYLQQQQAAGALSARFCGLPPEDSTSAQTLAPKKALSFIDGRNRLHELRLKHGRLRWRVDGETVLWGLQRLWYVRGDLTAEGPPPPDPGDPALPPVQPPLAAPGPDGGRPASPRSATPGTMLVAKGPLGQKVLLGISALCERAAGSMLPPTGLPRSLAQRAEAVREARRRALQRGALRLRLTARMRTGEKGQQALLPPRECILEVVPGKECIVIDRGRAAVVLPFCCATLVLSCQTEGGDSESDVPCCGSSASSPDAADVQQTSAAASEPQGGRGTAPRCAPPSPRRPLPVRCFVTAELCDAAAAAAQARELGCAAPPQQALRAVLSILADAGCGEVDPVVAQRLGPAALASPAAGGDGASPGIADVHRLVACLREGGVPVVLLPAKARGEEVLQRWSEAPEAPTAPAAASGDSPWPSDGVWAPPPAGPGWELMGQLRCLLLVVGRLEGTLFQKGSSKLASVLRHVADYIGTPLPLIMSQRARRDRLYAQLPPGGMRARIDSTLTRLREREQRRRGTPRRAGAASSAMSQVQFSRGPPPRPPQQPQGQRAVCRRP